MGQGCACVGQDLLEVPRTATAPIGEGRCGGTGTRIRALRIALLGPAYPFRGGIAHYTTCLYRALARRHRVRYLSFSRQYPRFLFPGRGDREPADSSYREPAAEPILDGLNPLTWLSTAGEIRRWKADLLVIPWWVPFWSPHFLTVFRRIGPRIRKIAICHNARPHEGGWLDRIASRLVLSQVDALIAHSTEEAETLRAALPGKACARSFHPIYDQERPSAPRSELRRRLGLAGPTLLFFGFVRPYKRLDLLLRALPAVRRRYPDVRLLVVGEFWKDSRREAEAILRGLELSDAVTIVDAYVSGAEMAEYVTAADLAVLPYASVTGSGVLQTAYGLGRPVVATRCGCFAEMVRDGEDGVLVAPDDADALAGGICRALAPETLARLTEGAAGAPERFAWSRMVRTIESLAGGSAAGESR